MKYIGVSSRVDVPVCGLFGLWPFRSGAFSVCGRFGLWPFRFVVVPVCGRFGLWPFRFVAVSVVADSVCGRYDLLPSRYTSPTKSVRPLSGLLHQVCRYYDFSLDTELLPVYVQPYCQLLVNKGLIYDAWTHFCINISYQSPCLCHRFCNIHTSCCLYYVDKIWNEI